MGPENLNLTLTFAVLAALVGSLIGSFANVVIYRLPRGESVAWPGSHCPNCKRRLSPAELVPVLSWLVQRGRCRGCGRPISGRYPLVELLMAGGFLGIALRWPPAEYGLTGVPLMVLFAVLLILTFIDIDTQTLPDALTLPALLLALAATFVWAPDSGLPDLQGAFLGATIAAGALTLINRIGGLALRRFRDTAERLWPVGFDQVNIAALVGLLFGWQAGMLAALASLLLNLVTRRTVRLPEGPVYLLWLLGFLALPYLPWLELPAALEGSLVAAGSAALAGAFWWWLHSLITPESAEQEPDPADDEPIAMGFGDAKLAAVLGALLGWQLFLVGLLAAIVLGAVIGLLGRLFGGERQIPFGPYLVAGGLLALLYGDGLLSWYLGLLTIS